MASEKGGVVEDVDASLQPRLLIRSRSNDDDPIVRRSEPTGSEQTGDTQSALGQGSLWAMVVLGVVSLSGLLFWVLAATSFAENAVGRAAAWYTLIQLAVITAAFGAPIMINRSAGDGDAAAKAGATTTLVIGIAAATGMVAPFFAGSQWSSLGGMDRSQLAILMLVLVVGSALVLPADARLVSLRRWRWLFARAAVPSIIRVLLLLTDPWADQAAWILVAAAGPVAVSGFVATAGLIRAGEINLAAPWRFNRLQRNFLAVQHLGAVATQIPYHVVPYLVARQVAPATNAAFYFVWAIGAMVSMVPVVLTQVLLSETSLARTGRVTMIRATLAANVTVVGLAWVLSVVVGPPLLEYFGPTYADLAGVLPFILLASLAWSVGSVCLTESRLDSDNLTTAVITLTIAFGSLVLALILMPSEPVWGATTAWLIANLTAAMLGIILVERRSR